ncbi:MAG TPA: chromosome segregation protein SMC, partial [Hyphomicrobiaceae bacterium]|nr:chromosome segregation protein SMC [Hyphomicrobiaceae bacterium]
RQARRYNELSDDIRKLEAIQLYLTWQEAQAQVEHEEAELQTALQLLSEATRAESAATRAEAAVAEQIQPLREQEMTRSAVVAHLTNEQVLLEKDAERARTRCAELEALINQITTDSAREETLIAEANGRIASLTTALDALRASENGDTSQEQALAGLLDTRTAELSQHEQEAAAAAAELSAAQAQLSALEASMRERRAQLGRLEAQHANLAAQATAAASQAPDAATHATIDLLVTELTLTLETLESDAVDAEAAVAASEALADSAQQARETAALALRQIETELQTLTRMLQRPGDTANAMAELVEVEPGFETALGAALGDDLEAPLDDTAPLHWAPLTPIDDDHALPEGIVSLARHVRAPPELQRALSQIGIVDGRKGAKLQKSLRPGQILVTTSGAVWRWDGLVSAADAPTAAAQRLALRNQIVELTDRQDEAAAAVDVAVRKAGDAAREVDEAKSREQILRTRYRETHSELASANRNLVDLQQRIRDSKARSDAIAEAIAAVGLDLEQAGAAIAALDLDRTSLAPTGDLENAAAAARERAGQTRDAAAQVRAELAGLQRERKHRTAQYKSFETDLASWTSRTAQGGRQLAALAKRLEQTKGELATISELPATLDDRRQRLLADLATAGAERRTAADQVIATEALLKEAVTALRAAGEAVSQRREERARVDARLEGARMKRQGIAQHIKTTLDTTPEGCLAKAGPDAGASDLPSLTEADARLSRLKTERDRLGGVNLQAEGELEAMLGQFSGLDQERVDVEEAIAKLRGGIASLNREGRKRLRQAFDEVNAHFTELFQTLFGGGEARLEMIEDSEDPLAGGLEIIAKPPGKKPTTLSLLSGGEQTLTALSLIFAVFLTNPSPICVLDEVDAPLDDANVDRFCALMEKMAKDTETRFLVITHHPMTMARMDRLYGVTMVEKGVSQLVSVDLASAEQLVEAV